MSTISPRVGFLLAGDGGAGEGGDDFVDVTTQISNNYSLIDKLLGVVRFTTAAGKPTTNNYEGKIAQEIDNGNLFIYDGAQWQILPGSTFTCTSGTRPTSPYTVYQGLRIWETDTKAWGVYDGANWVMWDSAWRPWTPAWPNVTLGNGVSTGAWRYVGDQIEFWAKLVRGSTTSFGAGSGMTLPAAAASTDAFTQLDAAGIQAGNNDVAICASSLLLSLTAVTFTVWNTATAYLIGGGYISNTAPHAWAAGDAILVRGRYRPA